METVRLLEERHGPSEFLGTSHVYIEEIADFDCPAESDWRVVFDAIARLRQDERLRTAGFRIVCWATY